MLVGDKSEKLRKDGTGFAIVRVQITYKEEWRLPLYIVENPSPRSSKDKVLKVERN